MGRLQLPRNVYCRHMANCLRDKKIIIKELVANRHIEESLPSNPDPFNNVRTHPERISPKSLQDSSTEWFPVLDSV